MWDSFKRKATFLSIAQHVISLMAVVTAEVLGMVVHHYNKFCTSTKFIYASQRFRFVMQLSFQFIQHFTVRWRTTSVQWLPQYKHEELFYAPKVTVRSRSDLPAPNSLKMKRKSELYVEMMNSFLTPKFKNFAGYN